MSINTVDRARTGKPSLDRLCRQRLVGAALIWLLVVQPAQISLAQQATPEQQQPAPAQQPQTPHAESPIPGGTDPPAAGQSLPATPAPQSDENSKPVGTAAAPYEKPVGVAGSRTEGAVIAPGKQKRVHSFVIKFGLIAGAVAAGGAIAALSMGSRSRP
jgi:hypothetical protein